ncbi:ATP-binding protein [Dawidia soli]|uniref:histidine kinase n=1 Tax=Dawidia soli TaxID=2782352 RepID=A0AAP2D5Y3_9BACT|nr:ATP-binding protein [Dawidia soli]MBT1685966.1 response regulator [Dawidia soli]
MASVSSQYAKGKAILLMLAIAVCLCILTGITIYRIYDKKRDAQEWVSHTNQVIYYAQRIEVNFHQAETNQRAFLLTGDSAFLNLNKESLKGLFNTLNKTRLLISDNDRQSRTLDSRLIPAIEARLRHMENTIRMFDRTSVAGAVYLQRVREGSKMDSTVDDHLRTLMQEEQRLLATRQGHLDFATSWAQRIIYLALLLISTVMVIAYGVILRARRRNMSLLASLEDNNKQLESRVASQTASITATNQELQRTNDNLVSLNEELRASEEEVRTSLDYITSLKNALEKSESHHRMLAENSLDIIAVFDRENRFEYLSPAVERSLGYTPTELIGTPGIDLIHPEDIVKLTPPDTIAEQGNEMQSPHFRLRKKNGGYVWIEAYSNPIFNEHGEVVRIQTLNRDITERKAIEIALQEAKARAEEATKIKSQFLSSMSHEIRTPMNAVINLTNILLDNDPRADQLTNLKLLKFSGSHLLAIINDILDFSKIEAGKMSLESIAFNLREMLAQLQALNEPRAREKNIAFTLTIDNTVPTFVVGDPVRLNQVLTNLVSNALKFTKQGQVYITVTSEKKSADLSQVTFTVHDTGIGIEPDKLDLIFESFSQASTDTTRKFGGTGLGLAITRNLVLLMQGEIAVASEYQRGATFTVTLPLTLDSTHGTSLQTEARPDALDTRLKGKVLLVEDNDTNQYIARTFLEKWGLQVSIANNGQEALQRVRDKSHQLVLMDLQMPVLDGYSASRAIRQLPDEYFHTLPIIALTADAMAETRSRIEEAGMHGHVSKPFDPQELKHAIAQYLPPDTGARQWLENFDAFTLGDASYKANLSKLIAGNLTELQASLSHAGEGLDSVEEFAVMVHKVKTALKILKSQELDECIENLRRALQHKNGALDETLDQFMEITNTIKGELLRHAVE